MGLPDLPNPNPVGGATPVYRPLIMPTPRDLEHRAAITEPHNGIPERKPYRWNSDGQQAHQRAAWAVHDLRAKLRGEAIIICACPAVPRPGSKPPPEITQAQAAALDTHRPAAAATGRATKSAERQARIRRYVAIHGERLSVAEAASQLGLDRRTIERYRRALRDQAAPEWDGSPSYEVRREAIEEWAG